MHMGHTTERCSRNGKRRCVPRLSRLLLIGVLTAIAVPQAAAAAPPSPAPPSAETSIKPDAGANENDPQLPKPVTPETEETPPAGPDAHFRSPAIAPESCATTLYTIGGRGSNQVSGLPFASVGSTSSVTVSTAFDVPTDIERRNALALSDGGSHAYFVGARGNTPHVFTYDTATGALTATRVTVPLTSWVAGAINPANGWFYFGDVRAGTNLNAYNPATGAVITVAHMPRETGTDGNGDYAFSAQGDLFVVSGDRLVSIPAAQIPVTPGTQQLPGTLISRGAFPVSNGIAFDGSGYLYVQSDDRSSGGWGRSAIRKVDPVTGQVIGSASLLNIEGTDLASCANPPTLSVQKNITDRVSPSDQFTLSLQAGNQTPLTTTTSGTATGIQPTPLGPTIALTDTVFRISEEGANGTDLSQYVSRYECVDTAHGNTVVASGTGTSFSYRAALEPGAAVMCTFTNTPKTPELRLTKVDASTPERTLAGATFQLWLDTNGDGALDPTVDTKVGSERTTGDDGLIVWDEGLRAGKYLLEETSSPIGYTSATPTVRALELDSEPHSITVENSRVLGSATWSKTNEDEQQLGGSEWLLRGPAVEGAPTPERTITDCVKAPCTGDDTDPNAGAFSVRNLAWGDYVLTEKKAPPGYVLDATPHHFTVGPGEPSLDVALGSFHNRQQPILPIPLTGGVGTFPILLSGGVLLALAASAVAVRRYRRT